MSDKETEVQEPSVDEQPVVEKPKPDKFDSLAKALRKTKEEMADLKAQIEAGKTAGTAPDEDENDVTAQLKSYKKEFDKLQRQLDNEKKQAQAEKDRSHLLGALNEAGVLGQKVLYNHLTTEGMVGRNDDGDMVFYTGGKNGVEKPLGEGLKEWLATAEGKMFRAPSGASGSGARPSNSLLPHKTSSSASKADKKADAERALMAWAAKIMPGKTE